MTDLGSASDWLKKISLTVRSIRITTKIWVVTHFCSRFSDVISCWKPVVTSPNVGCFLRLTWPCVHPSAFPVTHAESRYFQRNAIRTRCKLNYPLLCIASIKIHFLQQIAEKSLARVAHYHQNSFSRAFHLHVCVIPTI